MEFTYDNGRSIPFGDLPDAAQNLLCGLAVVYVSLQRDNKVPSVAFIDAVMADADETVQLVAGLLDRVRAVEEETQRLRAQLEAIGKKAFWARGSSRPKD